MHRWYLGLMLMDLAPSLENGGAGGTGGPAGGGATPPAGQTGTPATLTQAQLQSITAPLLQQVSQQVTTAMAPVLQEQQNLRNEITQLRQPRHQNASRLFGGGAPAVRQGEDPLTSRGYEYSRAMGFRQGFLGQDDAKVELEVHRQLHDVYVRQGGMVLQGNNSILVPLGAGMLCGMDDATQSDIRQRLDQGVANVTLDSMRWLMQRAGGFAQNMMRQALSQFDDSGLGTFIGPTTSGGLIELVRAREVFSRLGARQITLPPNGRLSFDRQTGSVTAYWVGEVPSNKTTPTITASEPTTGVMSLLAKKLACLVRLPNELLRFSSGEVEAFIRMDIAKAMGLKLDATALENVGSTNAPRGLINHNIQSHVAGTVATDGNTFEPEDVMLMLAKLEDSNFDTEDPSVGWVMRGKMWANLHNRRAAAHTAGTYDGNWLFPVNRDAMQNGMASALAGKPVVRSTQVSATRAKGASSDLSYILCGLFDEFIIGRVGVLEFATSVQGDTPFQTDQTWVRAIQHMDCAPRHEDAFVMCDQIDMDLPA